MTQPSAKKPPAPSIRRLTDLWTVLGKDRPLYAASIGVQGLVAALQYVVPLVPQSVMDTVFAQPGRTAQRSASGSWGTMGGAERVREHLWIPATVIGAAALLAAFLAVLRGRMTARAAQRSVRRLRERVHRHLLRLPCSYFDRTESGDLLQRCTSDVDTVQNLLSNQVAEMGRSVLLLLLAVPLMLSIDTGVALVSVALVVPIVLFAIFYFRVVVEFRTKDEAEGRLTARSQENITGIRVVRVWPPGVRAPGVPRAQRRAPGGGHRAVPRLCALLEPERRHLLLRAAAGAGGGHVARGARHAGRWRVLLLPVCVQHVHLAHSHAGPHAGRPGQGPGGAGAPA